MDLRKKKIEQYARPRPGVSKKLFRNRKKHKLNNDLSGYITRDPLHLQDKKFCRFKLTKFRDREFHNENKHHGIDFTPNFHSACKSAEYATDQREKREKMGKS